MDTADLSLYGLILIPFIGTLVAGYARLKVGPFFGLVVAGGAVSVLLSYLLIDFSAALIQLGSLALGAILFLLAIGLFGERFTYRSPMTLLAAVGLFPLGLVLVSGYLTPLFLYAILLGLNVIFAILLGRMRRNSLKSRKGTPTAKGRYFLTIPAIMSTVVVSLMILNSFSQGNLL